MDTRNEWRNRLISQHTEVARRIALKMARRCPDWVAREDLVAAGMLGLTEAAERYDTTREEPFLPFAEKRIRGAVLDELRRGDIMPRRARQMARKIGATIQALERTLGKSPSDEQVAEALGVTLEAYRTDLEHLVHVTVGALDPEDDTSAALVSDAFSPEAGAARAVPIKKLVELGDPRAVAALKRARDRTGSGDEGNGCLRGEADRAVKTLATK